MSQRTILASALIVVLACPAWVLSNPPARPKPLTVEQYRHLVELERQPEHLAVLDVQATYTSNREFDRDFTRASDDFWSVAWHAGFPGTILGILICAAPL
ncbi:MAG TPA: hypothetical protein PKG54_01370 [Phycisphaerae bacterium]|jgi:hypothetical protein|nr:hypothetical protein [Phycisphaerae bacterium]HOB73151.1 hypothetical protein [Phycisphaerae bacterium]HOJ53322.1 hypothetical protein [Phycisphaerae bacterium]HOL27208.1 hypothetical protein [Phycisphaerae bacterium]HPP21768.1 hypothetical protein [Phycisphaerae bacterium]